MLKSCTKIKRNDGVILLQIFSLYLVICDFKWSIVLLNDTIFSFISSFNIRQKIILDNLI